MMKNSVFLASIKDNWWYFWETGVHFYGKIDIKRTRIELNLRN